MTAQNKAIQHGVTQNTQFNPVTQPNNTLQPNKNNITTQHSTAQDNQLSTANSPHTHQLNSEQPNPVQHNIAQ